MNRLTVVVCFALLIAPVAGVAGATVGAATTSAPSDEIGDTEFDTNVSGVSVWESSPLPLRANSSAGEVIVENQRVEIAHWDNDYSAQQARYDELAVYNKTEPIPLELTNAVDVAPTDRYDDNTTRLVVGKLTPNSETGDSSPSADQIPRTISGLQDWFDEDRLDEVNENVTFKSIANETLENGEMDAEFVPDSNSEFGDGAGQYVTFAVVEKGDTNRSVKNGDFVPDSTGDSVIIGIDAFLVHEQPSEVTAEDIEPGDTASFDIDTGLEGDVNHTVALYNKEQFTDDNSLTTINITDEPDQNFSEDYLTIESEIESVNGVADFDGDVSMLGYTFSERTETGTFSVADIISMVAEDAERNEPEFEGNSTILDASVTGLANGDSNEILNITTYENWSEGEYQWVHIASTNDISEFETNAGTITVEEASDDDDEDDNNGGWSPSPGDGDDDDDSDDEDTVEEEETASPIVDEEKGKSTVSFQETSTEQITFDSADVTGDVTSRDLSSEPDETGPSPGTSTSVFEINVPENAKDTSATIRTTVSKDRINETGVNAEDLRINRFDEEKGKWHGLSTTLVEERDNEVVLEAQTPGFSYFSVSAVSEPTATATASPTTINPGEEVELDASGSENRYGEIVSYEWEIDGQTLSGEIVTTTLSDGGEYTAQLTVTNDADETGTDSVTITVEQEGDSDGGDDDGGDDDGGDGDGSDSDGDGGGLLPVPGFGLGITVTALAIALLVLRRRTP
ncbi:PGF-pre-PGF domain-containing protein [Natrinema sp. H-ect4]|uniref:PGF-pre-PGF domain-containing protein n=1 Tax=Natrinema sp. H-ect4 TaxID=3242699 RepID=UPI0035A8853B